MMKRKQIINDNIVVNKIFTEMRDFISDKTKIPKPNKYFVRDFKETTLYKSLVLEESMFNNCSSSNLLDCVKNKILNMSKNDLVNCLYLQQLGNIDYYTQHGTVYPNCKITGFFKNVYDDIMVNLEFEFNNKPIKLINVVLKDLVLNSVPPFERSLDIYA